VSFAALMNQKLAIERLSAGALDARRRAAPIWTKTATVWGRVGTTAWQSKESPQLDNAGVAIVQRQIDLLPTDTAGHPTDVTEKDRIRRDPADGTYFYPSLITDAGAKGHHLVAIAKEVRQ
jgi:hypothetical protein